MTTNADPKVDPDLLSPDSIINDLDVIRAETKAQERVALATVVMIVSVDKDDEIFTNIVVCGDHQAAMVGLDEMLNHREEVAQHIPEPKRH